MRRLTSSSFTSLRIVGKGSNGLAAPSSLISSSSSAVAAPCFGQLQQQRRLFVDPGGNRGNKPGNLTFDPNAIDKGEADSDGLNKVFGGRAQQAMRGMMGPQGHADGRESTAVPIPGKASIKGTQYSVERSTAFEHWHHVCPSPVGWHMSKLANATCKMANDVGEAADSLQLQIIKGCNVIEIDASASEMHQQISRSFAEALSAFELDREGFIVVARCGVIRQSPFQQEQTEVEVSNTAPIRSRIMPVFERYRASSLPGNQLKSGFRIDQLTDDQLSKLNLKRLSKTSAAALTPEWIEASLTNLTFQTRIECVDVLLLEGVHALFDDRPQEQIDQELTTLFAYMEGLVKMGLIQYYGISSPQLAPPLIRNMPALPADAMLPDRFKNPPPPHTPLNLYRIMEIARRAAGSADPDGHHLRFVQYPFNLTTHQALSCPLPYDTNHTLRSLTKALGLTAIGYSPIEAQDMQELQQRYHKFPMESDLKTLRMNFFSVAERTVLKETEVMDSIQKGPSSLPSLQELFVGSLYVAVQRQLCNLFFYLDWINHDVIPKFRRALVKLKEASPSDVKEWANQYEQLAMDLLRLRRRLFEHKHGAKAIEIDYAIDRIAPSLAKCPLLSQKALNFAAEGADVVSAGFHVSRYFHEATDLNPFCNGAMRIPEEELKALCASDEVSFANYNPPHPYMYEPITMQGKITGRKSKSHEAMVTIDPKEPKFPDIPEQLENAATGESDGDAAPAMPAGRNMP